MINTAWVKHLDPQKAEDFEQVLRNSTLVTSRLREIVHEWEAELLATDRSKKQYDVANWSELQAHRNGNLELIQKLKDLLSL